MSTLKMYTTKGCHLCDDALVLLKDFGFISGLKERNIKFEEIEISENLQLVERYGTRIPVIQLDSHPDLGWPFDENQLVQYLNAYMNG